MESKVASIRIQTDRLKNGMIIQNDVYTSNGVVIVPKGTVVTKEVQEFLTRHFVDDVIVEYVSKCNIRKSKEIRMSREKQEKINEFSYSFHIAEKMLSQDLWEIAKHDKEIDVPQLLSTVQDIVNNADSDVELCDMLLSMETSASGLYVHSIHVALYARLLARWVKLTPEEIDLVVLAGLLHDVGYLYGSENVPVCLQDELEQHCNKRHPHLGYKIVSDKSLDVRVKQAILTHHERLDGSGFPMGVTYSNISKVTRVLAIADVYVTLLLEEPGKAARTPFEVLEYLCTCELGKFDGVHKPYSAKLYSAQGTSE